MSESTKKTVRLSASMSELDEADALSIAYADADESLAGHPTAALIGELSARATGRRYSTGRYESGTEYRQLEISLEL